ncbi:hypothetical protein [Rhizobium sp. GR12]|uniref:hypothetical protein n=1 Tax=Rhizobium sp. GR12 TaxID=3053925 RepID=UPI002FBD3853
MVIQSVASRRTQTFVQRSCSKGASLPFSSPDEADKAAQAKAKSLKLGEGSTLVTVVVDTSICAGAPLLYADIRSGLDGVPYIIDTATHKYVTKGTLTTDIAGKVALNSAPGTPATPAHFLTPRLGRTDENLMTYCRHDAPAFHVWPLRVTCPRKQGSCASGL